MTTFDKLAALGFEYADGEYFRPFGDRWAVSIIEAGNHFILDCYNYITEQEFRRSYTNITSALKAMDLLVR